MSILVWENPNLSLSLIILLGVHSGDDGYKEKSTAHNWLQFRINEEEQRKKRSSSKYKQLKESYSKEQYQKQWKLTAELLQDDLMKHFSDWL